MPIYSTPGVYVNEAPLSSLVNAIPGGTHAVFFGEAERGPITPVLIQDWGTYLATYGPLSDQYDLGYAVYHYFANGGRGCYVNRVVNAGATAATCAAVPYYPTGQGGASSSLFTVDAVAPGTWGNSLTVQVTAGHLEPSDDVHGTFNLIVSLNGVEVERWPELTIDPDGSRYVSAIINTYSKFVRVSNVSTAAADADLEYVTSVLPLTGGTQSAVADADYVDALSNLDGIRGNLILNAVGQTSATVVSAVVSKAQSRGDSFAIIDPSKTAATFSDLTSLASSFAGFSAGGYAAHYTPCLQMIDPSKTGSGAVRTTYPGGAVAGIIVRSEVERTVAKPPAGLSADVRGALALSVPVTEAQIGELYDGTPQVNTFKVIPGAGVTVAGARTLNKLNPDKFINVRRTLNYLKYNLKELLEFAVFEPNDSNLWDSINLRVSGFLADFWRAGGLKGANAAQAFYVKCDSTNNTLTSIDQGIVHVEVGVSLSYPAEFVVINLSQWTGGETVATES